LHAHDVTDGLVLNRAQLGVVDPAFRVILARLEELWRAQQTADVVGAERRLVAHGHGGGEG
jgi:hypothetical protein